MNITSVHLTSTAYIIEYTVRIVGFSETYRFRTITKGEEKERSWGPDTHEFERPEDEGKRRGSVYPWLLLFRMIWTRYY